MAKENDVLDLSYLSDFVRRQNEGIDHKIVLPNGKEMGLTIKIVGPDSDRAGKAISATQQEFAAQATKIETDDQEETERSRRFAYAAKCCVSMTPPVIKIGEEEFKANEDDFRRLFTKMRFIGDQAYGHAISRSDFIES
jgi:hypothetical protein